MGCWWEMDSKQALGALTLFPFLYLPLLPLLAVPQELLLVPALIIPKPAAECQNLHQFRSGTHPIPCSGSSPLCQFPDWPGHSLPSAPL